jgi:hypothetical protein
MIPALRSPMTLRPISSLLGYRRGDLLAAIAARPSQPDLVVRDAYITAVVDFTPEMPEIEVSTTTVLHLSDCIKCGEVFANRVRVTSRNGVLYHPLDPRHTTSTETNWDADCTICRQARLNRERVARHRAQNRKQLDPLPCLHCGECFQPQRSTAKFCSATCRAAAHRAAGRHPVMG